jgi:GntR family transcriptional regulator, histidine utilization repressor
MSINNWQDARAEILNRIHIRQWKPGDLIPHEAELAKELGCARATVNRALRSVAEAGLVERRRKAGTRVAVHPVRKATLNISIIRHEIEERNQSYSYALISRKTRRPPADIRAQMGLPHDAQALYITALHLADGKPYVYEARWVNHATVPAIESADLKTQSANEWLVVNAPFTEGSIAFSAIEADAATAEILDVERGAALFMIERCTWDTGKSITSVRLIYAPGYRMHTMI